MKKYISFLMFLLTLLMSSCDMPLNGTAYEVKFDSDGGTSVTTQTIQEGKKASTPIDPTKDGYTFVYWMYNGEEFDFSTLIYNDIVLVAKWAVNHLHNYTKTIVEPTCTDNGYTLLKCSCGYSYKTDFISSTGHNLISHPRKEPTATEVGHEAYVECLDCGYTTYKEILNEKIVVKFIYQLYGFEQIINELIKVFEDMYPNVDVVSSNFYGYNYVNDKVSNIIESGETPTVVQLDSSDVPNYINKYDNVVDLNTYMNDRLFGFNSLGIKKNDFVEEFFNDCYIGSSLYGIPFQRTGDVLTYNKSVFDQYNWFVDLLGYDEDTVSSPDFIWHPTWEELELIGAEFNKKTRGVAFCYNSAAYTYVNLIQQLAELDENKQYGEFGQDAFIKRKANSLFGELNFIDINNPYSTKALEYYNKQLVNRYFTTLPALGEIYSSEAFKKSRCILTTGNTRSTTYNLTNDFEIGIATYPQFAATSEENRQVLQSGTNLVLLKQDNSAVEKYGWLFMMFLSNFENSLNIAMNSYDMPVRYDVCESEEYISFLNNSGSASVGLGRQALKVALSQLDWYVSPSYCVGFIDILLEAGSVFEDVLYKRRGIREAFETAKLNLVNYIS